MSLTISGVSSLDTSMNQLQTYAKSQSQNSSTSESSTSSDSSLNSDTVSLGQNDSSYDTYTANGTMSKAEFGASLISSTLDRMNTGNSSKSAQNDSYQFSKEVLGAYSKY